MSSEHKGPIERAKEALVSTLLHIPGVREKVEGNTEVYLKQFDPALDLEKEVPTFKLVIKDGELCFGFVNLQFDQQTESFVPNKAAMAALQRLAQEGKISEGDNDPTEAECKVLEAKAHATERYRQLTKGCVHLEKK